MILYVFWKVKGMEIKVICSDDSLNIVLFWMYFNCLGLRIVRSFLFSYGRFIYCNVWLNDKCLGSCLVYFGGWYSFMVGFS